MKCNTCSHARVCRFTNEYSTVETRVTTNKSAAPFELNCTEYSRKPPSSPYEAYAYQQSYDYGRSMGCDVK
jgi:hypothetical protein